MRRDAPDSGLDPSDLRVLLAEDDPKDEAALRALLEKARKPRVAITGCASLVAAVETLGTVPVDALLLDATLPDADGLDGLDRVRGLFPAIPVLVLAHAEDEAAAEQAFGRGAQEYLVKGQLVGPGLVRAIRHAVERKRSEKALRKSEERFELVARATNDAVWDLDLTTERLWWNVGARSQLGYPPDTVVSDVRWWRERLHPEDRERVLRTLDELLDGGGRFWMDEYRFRCADGSFAHVFDRGYIIREDEEKPVRMIGAMMDVTERRRAEEALREANETIRALVQAAPVGILVIDRQEKIRVWNPAAEQIFGWKAADVLGRPLVPLAPEADRDQIAPLVRQALSGEAVTGAEIPGGRKGGGSIDVSASLAPLRDARGHISGAMVVIVDVTQRKAAEQQRARLEARLLQSQKMEAVGRLAGGVAHDFNNLLTAISGYAELLQLQIEASNPLHAHAEQIHSASLRASQLVRQLLAFGRRQVLQPRVLDLNQVLQGMEGLLRRIVGEHIDLGMVLGPSLGSVRADQGQIEQVILSLAENARDVMPNGGKLTIETRDVNLDEAYASRHGRPRSGPHVLLAVSDTGCGMGPDILAHVFEPFFTTKEQDKGTGMSLASVYGIVKQTGGDIWVYSEPGLGATFKVYLPRVEMEPAPAAPEPAARATRGSETVLLAEDSDAVRRLLVEILRKHGYTVIEARNGAEALEIARRFEGPIHLLVTDMVMPQMSGRELHAHLSPARPGMKVLFMSGYAEEAIARHGVIDRGTAFVEKPFTPAVIARKIRELLDEQGA